MAGDRAVAFPLDATLGTEGTPQSGTGQMALLTGEDGPSLFGGHFGPWVPVALRPVVEERNVLTRALSAGHSAAFANAYPEDWPRPRRDPPAGQRARRTGLAAVPLAASAAGLMTRHAEALARGEAVASEIVNDGWKRHLGFTDLPDVTPEEAGRRLAEVARGVDLCLYAHYATDTAGHRGGMDGAVEALERVDRFLGGLVDRIGDDALLLVASDHGNIEDVTAGHTRNPVLGLLVGPGAEARSRALGSIRDVPGAILDWLRPLSPSPRPG